MGEDRIKRLRSMARDKRFISGIFNYCDRWCERCPFTARCLNFAMQEADDTDDPGARDTGNDKFWKKLEEIFRDTLTMIREDAKARGIDLEAPDTEAEARTEEQKARCFDEMEEPLVESAMAYAKAVTGWMKKSGPLFEAKGTELATQARLSVGRPQAEAEQLKEFADVISWYQYFIGAKLSRAVQGQAEDEMETDEEMKQFPKDSDGSAKIALIAIDRSISAWAGLREMMDSEDESILDLLAMLARIRRGAETLFPNARAFVRPGFDEPEKSKPKRKRKS